MDHREAEDALWEFYDGELAENKRAELEAHLAACAECRETLRVWKGAAQAFFPERPAPHPAQTEAFVLRAMERVEAAKPQPWTRLLRQARWLVPALGAGWAAALTIPGLRAVPDPAQAIILSQKGGQSFWSFLYQAPPSTHDEVLAFVEGQR